LVLSGLDGRFGELGGAADLAVVRPFYSRLVPIRRMAAWVW
jgi:hypothetical protein